MKIVDNFVWLIVTDKAIKIYMYSIFDLYVLNDDGSESLVTNGEQLMSALDKGLDIGIEVGHLNI